MAWIKFEKDLLTDPRVLRIARTLQARWKLYEVTAEGKGFEFGNDAALPAVTLVCGALVRIWCLADTHIGDDNLLPLGYDEIDDVVGMPGFCALVPSDWIVAVDANTVKLPEYHTHNGTEAKKKAATAQRVAKFRSRNAEPLQHRNALALPDLDQTKTSKHTRASRSESAALNGAFTDFWAAYPKKRSKGAAEKAWIKLHPDEQLTGRILAAVKRAKTSDDWQKDGGQFIPHPATWLNRKGWEDEITPAAQERPSW